MGILLRLLLYRLVAALVVTALAVGAIYASGAVVEHASIFFILPGGVLILLSLCTYLSCSGEGCLVDFIENQRENQREHYAKFIHTLRNRKLISIMTLVLGILLAGLGLLIRNGGSG